MKPLVYTNTLEVQYRNEPDPIAVPGEALVKAVGSGRTRAVASQFVKAGGVISHVGLQDNEAGLDTRRLTLAEVTFIGNYTYSVIDLKAAIQALHSGALGTLDWVETRPLADGATAFQDIHRGHTAVPKIVLLPESNCAI